MKSLKDPDGWRFIHFHYASSKTFLGISFILAHRKGKKHGGSHTGSFIVVGVEVKHIISIYIPLALDFSQMARAKCREICEM